MRHDISTPAFFAALLAGAFLVSHSHASEIHLSDRHPVLTTSPEEDTTLTHTHTHEQNVEDLPPFELDETKLGAELLHVPINSTHTHTNILEQLSSQWAAFWGKVIPPSDSECDWSWPQLKCVGVGVSDSANACKLKYKWMDYHIGHSCRLKTEEEKAADLAKKEAQEAKKTQQKGGGLKNVGKALQGVVGKVKEVTVGTLNGMNKGREAVVHHTVGAVSHVVGGIKSKFPPSDAQCVFDVRASVAKKEMVCTPVDECSYQFKLGDLTMNRSCRLKRESVWVMDDAEEE